MQEVAKYESCTLFAMYCLSYIRTYRSGLGGAHVICHEKLQNIQGILLGDLHAPQG